MKEFVSHWYMPLFVKTMRVLTTFEKETKETISNEATRPCATSYPIVSTSTIIQYKFHLATSLTGS